MRRLSIGRLIGIAFLATVVTLLSFDTTQACRFWGRLRHCCPPVMCVPVRMTAVTTCCPAPVECGTTCVSSPVVYELPTCSPCPTDCCETIVGGETVIGETVVTDSCEMATGCEPIVEPYPMESVPSTDAAPTVMEPVPTVEEPTPAVEEATPVEVPEPPVEEPTAEDELLDEPVVLPALDEEPILDETPPVEEATEPAPLDDDLDIFGEEPAADAVTPPADTTPATDDALDDIFSEPATDDAAPALDEALPADVPTEGGADDLDDLFGGPADAAAPAEEAVADDLFGDLDAAAPAETPAETPAAAPAADDLFPLDEQPPADGAAPVEESDDLDDLFGTRSHERQVQEVSVATQAVSGPATAMSFRIWTDNTGNYQTVGRLVQVSESHVRLLKDNGRFSTVSRTRLSQADLAYVDQMVKQLGLQVNGQLAAR